MSADSSPDEGNAESCDEEDFAGYILEMSCEIVLHAARAEAVLSRCSFVQTLTEILDEALTIWEEQKIIGMVADKIDWIFDRDGNVYTCASRRAQSWQGIPKGSKPEP